MEPVIIPGWFLWIVGGFITLFVPWAIWITNEIFKNDKAIALNIANDTRINDDIRDIQAMILRIDSKLDLFLNHEINTLKNLIALATK